MIIKPYIKWPKLSELKEGDRIRLKEKSGLGEKYDMWEGKLVTIVSINLYNMFDESFIKIKELGDTQWYYWRFEVHNK